MALSVRKKPATVRKVPKPKSKRSENQPFNVLKSPYKTQGDVTRAVRERAKQSYTPALREIEAQKKEEEATHLGRTQDIERFYGFWNRSLSDAYERTNSALNHLITNRDEMSKVSRGSLEAALRASDMAASERASALGVRPGASESQGLNTAAYGAEQAETNSLAGQAASMIAAASQRQSLGSVGAIQESNRESARNRNILENLRTQRSRITGQIPAYEETAREQLYQQLLAQQNQGFQQGLAGRQFGLSREQFGLDVQRQKHQEKVDWANAAINQHQVENEAARIQKEIDKFTNNEQKTLAQAKARRWDKGSEWLSKYLTPGPSDIVKIHGEEGKTTTKINPKTYTRDFTQAYRVLTVRYGMDPISAYRLLSTVTLTGWRKNALSQIRKREPKGGLSTPQQLARKRTTPLTKRPPK